jgi:hypothetical protein
MADSTLVLNATVLGIDTITEIYEAPPGSAGVIISAFTVSNSTASSVSYKAYIYAADGSTNQPIVPQTIVVLDRFSSAPSAINHVIPAGGSLRVENSAASSLSFTVSGRVQ